MALRRVQIALAVAAPVVALQPPHGFRKLLIGGAVAAYGGGDAAQDRQFGGAFHLAVAGENLLDERGARARQADDEDRIRRRLTAAGDGCQKRAVEHRHDAGVALLHRHRIVLHLRPVQPVAGVELRPGAVVVFGVLQRLAEREAKVDLLAVVQVAAFELASHGANLGRFEAEHLQIGQAPIRFAEAGAQRDRAPIGRQRRWLVAHRLQCMRQAQLRAGRIRMQRQRAAVRVDAGFRLAGLRVGTAEAGPGSGVRWRGRHGLAVGVDGLMVLVPFHQHAAQSEPCRSEVRR